MLLFFLFAFIHIDSHSILFRPLINVIESSHIDPTSLPFRFRRRPSQSSATVNVVVAATAAPAVAAAVGSSPLSPSLLPPLLLMQHINTGFCHGVGKMCPSVT